MEINSPVLEIIFVLVLIIIIIIIIIQAFVRRTMSASELNLRRRFWSQPFKFQFLFSIHNLFSFSLYVIFL